MMNDGKKILGLKVADSGCLYYHRRVGGVAPSDFDRLIAVARFLVEDAAEPPFGATVH